MIGLENLNLEYKSGAFFAIFAFVLTLIAGIAGNLDASVIIIRILISLPLFALIGYGVIYVLKLYVPEVYELLTSMQGLKERPEPGEMELETAAGSDSEIEETQAEKTQEEFTETKTSDYEHLDTPVTTAMDDSLNISQGKMGKHVVVNEKFVKYEPKVMAQAVRTMMRKDEE